MLWLLVAIVAFANLALAAVASGGEAKSEGNEKSKDEQSIPVSGGVEEFSAGELKVLFLDLKHAPPGSPSGIRRKLSPRLFCSSANRTLRNPNRHTRMWVLPTSSLGVSTHVTTLRLARRSS